MNMFLAVLTCVPRGSDDAIKLRLRDCLHSIGRLDSVSHVALVIDDGSELQLKSIISAYRPLIKTVHVRRTRGGISRAKNTCLRLFLESGCDVGFIAEDDLEFKSPFCLQEYAAAMRQTGVNHFSWSWDYDPEKQWRRIESINGYEICETSRVNGSLLAFTRGAVEKVGGFPVLPALWGHEHTNWTKRMITSGQCPFFADIVDSNLYAQMGRYHTHSVVSEEQKREFAQQNEFCIHNIGPIYQPIME